MTTSTNDRESPYTVAIVAMGRSHQDYMELCLRQSSRLKVADETWAINAMAGVIDHDRAFIMDALPYFAKASREENPALDGYKDWLHRHPGPIYTQRVYEGFPGSVEYPLLDVLNVINVPYLNTTVAYAIAYAIYLQVKHLKIFGCDFTYGPNNRGFAEAGRACVEFWIRDCAWRGMKVDIADTSCLCDHSLGRPSLYGYSAPPPLAMQNGKFVFKSKS